MALFLVVLMSIDSIAAIVSDNDGSAFITKAEFEAMKNDFVEQVDNYNSSIDGKIDGAIAAYLAGLQMTRKTTIDNMFTLAKKDNEKNLGFMLWQTAQASINVEDVLAGYFVACSWGGGEAANSSNGKYYGYTQISNVANGSGEYREVDYLGTTKKNGNGVYNDDKKNWTSAYYFVNFPFKGESENKDLENWTLENIQRQRLYMHLKANSLIFYSTGNTSAVGARFTGSFTTDFSANLDKPGSFTHSKQGTNGSTDMTPLCVQVHTWSSYDENTDKDKNNYLNYNLAGEIKDDKTCHAVEYEYRDYYNSGDLARFGKTEVKNIQIQDIAPTTTITPTWAYGGSRVDVLRNGSSASNYGNGHNVTFRWKYYFPKIFELKWSKITNKYYNTLFANPHYKYYGIPITNVTQTGKITFRLTLTNNTADSFKYSIMDARHINGDLEEQRKESYKGDLVDRVMKYGQLSGKKTHTIDVEFDKKVIWDKNNGDYIWLKVQPSKAGQLVTADIIGDVKAEFKLY